MPTQSTFRVCNDSIRFGDFDWDMAGERILLSLAGDFCNLHGIVCMPQEMNGINLSPEE